MAGGLYNFSATMQINLASGTVQNLRSQVQSQLKGLTVPVQLTLPPNALNALTGLNTQVKALQANLAGLGASAGSLNTIATSLGRVGSTAASTNAAISTTTSTVRTAGSAVSKFADQFEYFGHQARLAGQRWLAFVTTVGTISAVFRSFRTALTEAISFEKQMTKIAQISTESTAEIAVIPQTVSRVAQAWGVSSSSLIGVAEQLKQTGLSIKDVNQAIEAVAKASLAPTFGDINKTTQGAIAAMRQFKIETSQLEETFGSINAVSAQFAVESGDIIEAVKRAGGVFASAGGSLNEFQALFTSVRATTRQSAEVIATGLRTIFTRIQRPETIEHLKALGVNLQFTAREAQQLGNVNLAGTFVGPLEAVQRLGAAIKDLQATDPRFAAIAEQIGGYRQIAQVIPLLQQQKTITEALNVAQSGGISLTIAAEKAQGQLAVQAQHVKEEFLTLGRAIVNSSGFRGMVTSILSVASALIQVVNAARPLLPLLTALAAIKIGQGIGSFFSGVFGRVSPQVKTPTGAVGGYFPASSIPREFGGAGVIPRYHTGGRVPGVGEQLALVEGGEVILPRRGRYAGGGISTSAFGNFGHVSTGAGRRLSEDELKVLTDYTSEGQDDIINTNLREGLGRLGGIRRPKVKRQINTLTKVVKQGRLTGENVLYRGISMSLLPEKVKADLTDPASTGKVFTEHGFMSTSTSESAARTFGGHLLEIIPKKGRAGISLEQEEFGKNTHEKEVLLQRGLKFRVARVEDGRTTLQMLAGGGVVAKLDKSKMGGADHIGIVNYQQQSGLGAKSNLIVPFTSLSGEPAKKVAGISTTKSGSGASTTTVSSTTGATYVDISQVRREARDKFRLAESGAPSKRLLPNLDQPESSQMKEFIADQLVANNIPDDKIALYREIYQREYLKAKKEGKLGPVKPAIPKERERAYVDKATKSYLDAMGVFSRGYRPDAVEVGLKRYGLKPAFKASAKSIFRKNISNAISTAADELIGLLPLASRGAARTTPIKDIYDRAITNQGSGRFFEAVLQAVNDNIPKTSNQNFDFTPNNNARMQEIVGLPANVFADAKLTDDYASRLNIVKKAIREFGLDYIPLPAGRPAYMQQLAGAENLEDVVNRAGPKGFDFLGNVEKYSASLTGRPGSPTVDTGLQTSLERRASSQADNPTLLALGLARRKFKTLNKFAQGGLSADYRSGSSTTPGRKNSIVNASNVKTVLQEFSQSTGIDFRKFFDTIKVRKDIDESDKNWTWEGSFEPTTKGKRVIRLSSRGITTMDDLRLVLAHELGHAVDHTVARKSGLDYATDRRGTTTFKFGKRESNYRKLDDAFTFGLPKDVKQYRYDVSEGFADVFARQVTGIGKTAETALVDRGFRRQVLDKLGRATNKSYKGESLGFIDRLANRKIIGAPLRWLGFAQGGPANALVMPGEYIVPPNQVQKIGLNTLHRVNDQGKFDIGGMVPGSGSQDNVPVQLAPGSFVIRKRSVQQIGMGGLARLGHYVVGGLARLERFGTGGKWTLEQIKDFMQRRLPGKDDQPGPTITEALQERMAGSGMFKALGEGNQSEVWSRLEKEMMSYRPKKNVKSTPEVNFLAKAGKALPTIYRGIAQEKGISLIDPSLTEAQQDMGLTVGDKLTPEQLETVVGRNAARIFGAIGGLQRKFGPQADVEGSLNAALYDAGRKFDPSQVKVKKGEQPLTFDDMLGGTPERQKRADIAFRTHVFHDAAAKLRQEAQRDKRKEVLSEEQAVNLPSSQADVQTVNTLVKSNALDSDSGSYPSNPDLDTSGRYFTKNVQAVITKLDKDKSKVRSAEAESAAREIEQQSRVTPQVAKVGDPKSVLSRFRKAKVIPRFTPQVGTPSPSAQLQRPDLFTQPITTNDLKQAQGRQATLGELYKGSQAVNAITPPVGNASGALLLEDRRAATSPTVPTPISPASSSQGDEQKKSLHNQSAGGGASQPTLSQLEARKDYLKKSFSTLTKGAKDNFSDKGLLQNILHAKANVARQIIETSKQIEQAEEARRVVGPTSPPRTQAATDVATSPTPVSPAGSSSEDVQKKSLSQPPTPTVPPQPTTTPISPASSGAKPPTPPVKPPAPPPPDDEDPKKRARKISFSKSKVSPAKVVDPNLLSPNPEEPSTLGEIPDQLQPLAGKTFSTSGGFVRPVRSRANRLVTTNEQARKLHEDREAALALQAEAQQTFVGQALAKQDTTRSAADLAYARQQSQEVLGELDKRALIPLQPTLEVDTGKGTEHRVGKRAAGFGENLPQPGGPTIDAPLLAGRPEATEQYLTLSKAETAARIRYEEEKRRVESQPNVNKSAMNKAKEELERVSARKAKFAEGYEKEKGLFIPQYEQRELAQFVKETKDKAKVTPTTPEQAKRRQFEVAEEERLRNQREQGKVALARLLEEDEYQKQVLAEPRGEEEAQRKREKRQAGKPGGDELGNRGNQIALRNRRLAEVRERRRVEEADRALNPPGYQITTLGSLVNRRAEAEVERQGGYGALSQESVEKIRTEQALRAKKEYLSRTFAQVKAQRPGVSNEEAGAIARQQLQYTLENEAKVREAQRIAAETGGDVNQILREQLKGDPQAHLLVDRRSGRIAGNQENVNALLGQGRRVDALDRGRAAQYRARGVGSAGSIARTEEEVKNNILPAGLLQRRVEEEVSRRGGADRISQKTRKEIIDQQEIRLKEEIVAVTQRQIQAQRRGITASEAKNLAEERYQAALATGERVLRDRRTGKVLGFADNVNAQIDSRARLDGYGPVSGWFADRFNGIRQGAGNFRTGYANLNNRISSALGLDRVGGMGQAALVGASVAGSYASAGLDKLAGSAENAVIGGSETKFKAYKQGAGAFQGAILGASILGAIPGLGILGGALGAAGGAAIGFYTSMKEAEAQLRQVRLATALNLFSEKLTAISNDRVFNLRGGGTLAATEALGEIGKIKKENEATAVEEASSFFGAFFDPRKSAEILEKENRSSLGSQLGGISSVLSDNIGELVKKNTRAKPEDLLAELKVANNGLNQELLRIIATLRRLPLATIEEEFRKQIIKAQNLAINEQTAKLGQASEERAINAFGRMVTAAELAASGLIKLEQKARLASELFSGDVSATPVLNYADRFKNIGASTDQTQLIEALSVVRSAGGRTGDQFRESALAASDVAAFLPTVLGEALARKPLDETGYVNNVREGLTQRLGFAGGQLPNEYQTALNSVLGQLSKLQLPDIAQGVSVDSSKFSEKLLSALVEPFAATGSKFSREMENASNRYIEGVTQSYKQIRIMEEGLGRIDQINLGKIRQEAAFRGEELGQPAGALNAITLGQLQQPFQAQQERLSGFRGAASTDPAFLVRRLQDARQLVAGALERRNEVQRLTGGKGEAFTAAADNLAKLKDSASRLQLALHGLANVTERNRALEEKAARFQADKEGRLGFAERFINSSEEERVTSQRGLLLANAAHQAGSLRGFAQPDQQLILQTLGSLGGAKLTGFKDQPIASDVKLQLIREFFKGLLQDPGNQREEADVRTQMLANFDDGKKAWEGLLEHQKGLNTDLIASLKEAHNQFYKQLGDTFARHEATRLQVQKDQVVGEQYKLQPYIKARETLGGFGITTDDQVQAVQKKRDLYNELASKQKELDDYRKIFHDKKGEALKNVEKDVLEYGSAGTFGREIDWRTGYAGYDRKFINAITDATPESARQNQDVYGVARDFKQIANKNLLDIGVAPYKINTEPKTIKAIQDALSQALENDYKRQIEVKQKAVGLTTEKLKSSGLPVEALTSVDKTGEFLRAIDLLGKKSFADLDASIAATTLQFQNLTKAIDQVKTEPGPGASVDRRFGLARGGVVRLANGGLVDSLVMPGEMIFSPEQVGKIGVGQLERMNKQGKRGGGASSLAVGGLVPGVGNTDSVPLSLPVGSYVLNKQSTKALMGFAGGGVVSSDLAKLQQEEEQFTKRYDAAGYLKQFEMKREFYKLMGTSDLYAIQTRFRDQESWQALSPEWQGYISGMISIHKRENKDTRERTQADAKQVHANLFQARLDTPRVGAEEAKRREQTAYEAGKVEFANNALNQAMHEEFLKLESDPDKVRENQLNAEFFSPEQKGRIRALRESQSEYINQQLERARGLTIKDEKGKTLLGELKDSDTLRKSSEFEILKQAGISRLLARPDSFEKKKKFFEENTRYGDPAFFDKYNRGKKSFSLDDQIDYEANRARYEQFLKERAEVEAKEVKGRQEPGAGGAAAPNFLLPGQDMERARLALQVEDQLNRQAIANPSGASAMLILKRKIEQEQKERRGAARNLPARVAERERDELAHVLSHAYFGLQAQSLRRRQRLAQMGDLPGRPGNEWQRAIAGAALGQKAQDAKKPNPDPFLNQLLDKGRRARLGRQQLPFRPPVWAEGGFVSGEGNQDSVPALLQPNEFVLTRAATRAIGPANLERVNRFATGGLVPGGGAFPASSGGIGGIGLSSEAVSAMNAFADSSQTLATNLNNFNESARSLAQAFNSFGDNGRTLAEALRNFPSNLTVTSTGTHNIVLNGASVLQGLMPALKEMIEGEISAYIRKMLLEKFNGDV